MKIIVTHTSPDWDGIGSIWVLKKYLPGWEDASLQFVPAGQRLPKSKEQSAKSKDPIEKIGEDEVIHVDTGMGSLDHHQTSDNNVSAASLTWEYVKSANNDLRDQKSDHMRATIEAIGRIMKIIVDIDHFKEVFWENPTADYHEFSLLGVMEGIKFEKQNQDSYYVEFGLTCLNGLLHGFENRIWAEKEIAHNGIEFETKWGKGIGFETLNDAVVKLAQKMGYVIVVRKDPRKGYVRIKARPTRPASSDSLLASSRNQKLAASSQQPASTTKRGEPEANIDLTLVYEQLSKMDPEATWYLHVSKKMLLNGTPKNPKMIPTKLGLEEIINVLKSE